MTMRKNPNHREVIKNMVLLRKHNARIVSLKYLNKPTNKIIPPLKFKVQPMQIKMFVSRLPNAWKQLLLVKPYSLLVIRLKFCLQAEKDRRR